MQSMPKTDMPSGALVLLILRVLRSGALHGYAIAQRIHVLSSEVLHVEEGSLYPALQKILLKGWVSAEWGISETNRKVRFYRLTTAGRKQLEAELSEYDRVNEPIQPVCAPPKKAPHEQVVSPSPISAAPPPLRPGTG